MDLKTQLSRALTVNGMVMPFIRSGDVFMGNGQLVSRGIDSDDAALQLIMFSRGLMRASREEDQEE